MLHSFKRILNTALHAKDGQIGHLDDLLFDDQTWFVRYVVVRTGGFLNRHRVLISPFGVARVDWHNGVLDLNLTRQQIEESPDVDTDAPLFRQMEKRYFDYYSWPYYWSEMSVWGIDPRHSIMSGEIQPPTGASAEGAPPFEERAEQQAEEPPGDPHLRSFREVVRYDVESEDTAFAHVSDVLFDDGSWTVPYLQATATKWWHKQVFFIDTAWIRTIDWPGRSVKLQLARHEIERTPEFERRRHEDAPPP